MLPEERERMEDLCKRIAVEKNPETFDELVRELNDLLDLKYQRIHPKNRTASN